MVLKPVAGPCANDPRTKRKGRCKLHGGRSTGPTTEAGLARLTEAKIKHGSSPKRRRQKRSARAEQGRQMRGELTETGDLVRGPRTFGQEVAGLVQVIMSGSIRPFTTLKRFCGVTFCNRSIAVSWRCAQLDFKNPPSFVSPLTLLPHMQGLGEGA